MRWEENRFEKGECKQRPESVLYSTSGLKLLSFLQGGGEKPGRPVLAGFVEQPVKTRVTRLFERHLDEGGIPGIRPEVADSLDSQLAHAKELRDGVHFEVDQQGGLRPVHAGPFHLASRRLVAEVDRII